MRMRNRRKDEPVLKPLDKQIRRDEWVVCFALAALALLIAVMAYYNIH